MGQTDLLNKHLYLSGVWLCVDLRRDSQNDTCPKVTGLCVHGLLTILGTTISIFGGIHMIIQ